eukprot:TRINITY_DN39985_c0_g3_i1.p1 TRINITY_DN39985_c0_g3~~TRINITY_DN39985_c0_g3_i1.p1  ORF type:complete len:325 (+),score=62.76 TRINITY_DN39985_c0_g3_i1:123-1097(+)
MGSIAPVVLIWFALGGSRARARFLEETALEDGPPKGGPSNLCMGGRLVPAFYLLGVQKAGTTTFASLLKRSEEIHMIAKEMHYFDGIAAQKPGSRSRWLEKWPACSDFAGKRLVPTDCTPDYLAVDNVPHLIANYYGPKKSMVTFAVLLREPLSRMKSAFFKTQNAWRKKADSMTFAAYVEKVVRTSGDPWKRGPFAMSLYARQLRNYFDVLPSRNFHIIPWKFQVDWQKLNVTPAVKAMWKVLGVKESLKTNFTDTKNKGPLMESCKTNIPKPLLTQLNALFGKDATGMPLAKVLNGSGAQLYEFHGKTDNEAEISKWIEAHW